MLIDTLLRACEMAPLFVPILALAASQLYPQERTKLHWLAYGQLTALAASVLGLIIFFHEPAPAGFVLIPNLIVVRIDFLAACMAVLISFISSTIVFFAERSLVGEKHSLKIIQQLVVLATVACWLVSSNSLVLLVGCWSAISYLLWSLLNTRPAANESARLLLMHHLVADALLWTASGLIIYHCHTANLSALASHTWMLQSHVHLFGCTMPITLCDVISLMVVLSMTIKSALFPFHRWLLAMLDGPTALSGLLHGGVVNVSAILAARLFPVLNGSTMALVLLGIIAGNSALCATLVSATQSAVKRKLVYSTAGQMGFMLLAVACGNIPVAVFHLMSHALFKCHAFLSAGSAVSEGTLKRKWGHAHTTTAMYEDSQTGWTITLLAASSMCVWLALDPSAGSKSPLLLLIAAIAAAPTVPAFKRINSGQLVFVGIVFLAALAISRLVAIQFDAGLSHIPTMTSWLWAVSVGSIALVGLLLHVLKDSDFAKAIYVHALNAFYLDEWLATAKGRLAVILTRKLKRWNSSS